MPSGNILDEVSQPFCIPSIGKHGSLKDLVQDRPVYEGSTRVASSFDPVLKYGTSSTTK